MSYIATTASPSPSLRFADLFAGLGGFHVALIQLGHKCVFACEIDEVLRKVYEQNFDMTPAGDIRKVDIGDVPAHDLLCAGFPCQPFSKAGEQPGFDCPTQGDLFDYVVRILSARNAQGSAIKKVVTPEAKRSVVGFWRSQHAVSERRACRLIGLCRATQRYAKRPERRPELRVRLRELAEQRRRFGYRRLHILLEREGAVVNVKRVRRLYREEPVAAAAPRTAPQSRNSRPCRFAGSHQSTVVVGLHDRRTGRRQTIPCAERRR
ncbi:MAG TPA: DNA (cytosine-5-)-methyltransferase [Burkholderiales bacterium]|nr:DNA (cytosine-5-)-methyltransferase [Burkholderiales bacterium]